MVQIVKVKDILDDYGQYLMYVFIMWLFDALYADDLVRLRFFIERFLTDKSVKRHFRRSHGRSVN